MRRDRSPFVLLVFEDLLLADGVEPVLAPQVLTLEVLLTQLEGLVEVTA